VDWAESTVATIYRRQYEAIPVAFMLDTPYPGRYVPECIANKRAARDDGGDARGSRRHGRRADLLVLRGPGLPGDRERDAGVPRREPRLHRVQRVAAPMLAPLFDGVAVQNPAAAEGPP
jgi:hypothetical protein